MSGIDSGMTGPVLRSLRLHLVPLGAGDLSLVHAMWTDAHVRRYLWDDRIISRERSAEVLEESARDFAEHSYGLWALAGAREGDILGFCGLRERGGAPELLFGLYHGWWKHGYAEEAARAVLRFAFSSLKLPAVHASVNRENTASVQVLERLGMRRDGDADGDVLHYSLRAEKYVDDQ